MDPSGNTLYPKPTDTKPAVELYGNPLETLAPLPYGGDDNGTGDDTNHEPSSDCDDDDESESPSGSWARQAYYDAEKQTAQGLVFMNHRGGQGSGVFDQK